VFTQGSGGSVTVPNGANAIIYCDGAGSGAKVTDFTSNLLRSSNNLSDLDDGEAALVNLGVTANTTELGYLVGVTSAIQTQLDAKYEAATQPEADWEVGTSTTETLVSPAKIKAAIEANSDPATAFPATTVSGATQSLDLGSFNFFDAGTLTTNTTISFTNVPTAAKWQYTFTGDILTTYDLENAYYDNVRFNTSGQLQDASGFFFKSDGTKLYVIDLQGDEKVYQYSLSTAWDVSTASYDTAFFDVSGQTFGPTAIFLKDDGTKMYVLGSDETVYQYSLFTAWDVSTASYDTVLFDVSGQEPSATHMFFKDDGTKMYVVGSSNDTVYQYSLSTGWDLNTASYDTVSFDVGGQDSFCRAVWFKDDGTKMYVLGFTTKAIYQYSLSTAWNVGTASYDTVFLYLIGDAFSPSSLSFKSDGAQMYVLAGADTIYQYTTATGISLTLPASVQNSPSERFTTERVTYEFYTLDGGTNVYLISEDIQ